MNRSPVLPSNTASRLLARGLNFLAILTAILYLRAILAGGLFSTGNGWLLGWSLAFMIVGLVALVALFRWERAGSLLAIGAGAALFALFLLAGQPVMTVIFYSSPFIIVGLLTLYCWWRECRA